jgi:hypothetical protein
MIVWPIVCGSTAALKDGEADAFATRDWTGRRKKVTLSRMAH